MTPDDEKTGSSSLHSVYESVSSLSNEGSATDQRPPSSLNSIYNAVNPLLGEGWQQSASSLSSVSTEEEGAGQDLRQRTSPVSRRALLHASAQSRSKWVDTLALTRAYCTTCGQAARI